MLYTESQTTLLANPSCSELTEKNCLYESTEAGNHV